MKEEVKKDGKLFLEEVSEKLQERLFKLAETLLAGQQEIENMHTYYWENYTEMDQYGYEDFDNQQALLHQINANNEAQLLYQRFQKMSDAPFFGRVDFVYDGEEDAEVFYIGIGNFAERTGAVPLIYDWRAPVSGLFYDYDKGPASYEAPGEMMEGQIEAKWQYKIQGGKMLYGFESDVKIDDDILKQELGQNGDVQLKNIVRTIQREQNDIIRNTKDKILVIQGTAGSGKTSVALHRIAYLLYHDREHLKSSNILVLSPNGVFSDYISHILPELGEENIREMSFDLFAYQELKGIVPDCEDRYHQIERQMEGMTEEEQSRYEFKQSQAYIGAVEGFLAGLEEDLVELKDFEWRRMKKTEEELIELFYFKFQEIPLLERMYAVMDYVVDEFETLYGRDLKEEELEAVREKFDRMYVTRDVYQIYNWFLEENRLETLPDVPYESRMLSYEDVFPMLYLKYRLSGKAKHKQIKHLVIDEMQDYSYLQYAVLETLFSCRMTILGDRAQTMDGKIQDVLTFLPKIFGKEIRTIVMNKSYRNTIEIARYAEQITNVTGLEFLERHGKAVEEKTVSGIADALCEIEEQLHVRKKSSLKENHCPEAADHSFGQQDPAGESFETAAVLLRTEAEARAVYERLKAQRKDVHYIDRDSSHFEKGVTVTTFYLAKGLEFDQVFVLRNRTESAFERQADYICATRALHELYMYQLENNEHVQDSAKTSFSWPDCPEQEWEKNNEKRN